MFATSVGWECWRECMTLPGQARPKVTMPEVMSMTGRMVSELS